MDKAGNPKPLIRYKYPIRSRYAETDQMGVVYHGRYVEYFETARTEFIREAGFSYKSLEDSGVIMPVTEVYLKFHQPVLYDDVVDVCLTINSMPSVKLETSYEIFSKSGKKHVTGKVTLCFLNRETGRPCRAPEAFINCIQAYIKKHG